jgi:16S rRNA (adenine1518-N6/adenine1519-N6)-dimethyltransferase
MPRRRLGQHFLRDDATARKLVERAGIRPGETVLEIGPGTGRLTRALLAVADRVVAVELDPVLASSLPERVGEPERLTVRHADATDIDFDRLLLDAVGPDGRARAVGNLPYESGTPILTRLLDAGPRLSGIAVVVQREVAERIAAPPGSRTYGYLSVVCQDVAEPRILWRLRPGAFKPPPKVHSALVGLALRPAPRRGEIDVATFRTFVGGLFERRRKTILNNLRARTGLARGAAEAILVRAGLEPTLRPESLSVEQFAALCREAGLPGPSDPL